MVLLKPCPFCGSKNVDLTVNPDAEGYREDLVIVCKDCGGAILGPSGYCEDMTAGDFSQKEIDDIVAAWNRRCDFHGSD